MKRRPTTTSLGRWPTAKRSKARPAATFVGVEGEDQTFTLGLNITSPYGCTADAAVEATVHRAPVADFELSDMAACAGTEIALDDRDMFADVVTLDWGGATVLRKMPQTFMSSATSTMNPRWSRSSKPPPRRLDAAQAMVNHTIYPKSPQISCRRWPLAHLSR